jgi:hypothetical protein
MADEEEVRVVLDPATFGRVLRDLKGFDKSLSTQVRKQLRTAGKILLDAAAAEIRTYPAVKYQTGMREQLAKSLAVRINNTAGSSRQGISVVSTGRLLPANKRILVKAMNQAVVHHTLYAQGKRGAGKSRAGEQNRTHVDQPGMRYFRQSIATAHEAEIKRLIEAALDEAVRGMQ